MSTRPEIVSSTSSTYYERPGMLALAGRRRRPSDPGRRLRLGPLSAALRDRGAVVTGIDASAGMVALAKRRLGDDVALHASYACLRAARWGEVAGRAVPLWTDGGLPPAQPMAMQASRSR